jgi:hypothetical protein
MNQDAIVRAVRQDVSRPMISLRNHWISSFARNNSETSIRPLRDKGPVTGRVDADMTDGPSAQRLGNPGRFESLVRLHVDQPEYAAIGDAGPTPPS